MVPLSLAALALALRVAHDVPSDLGLENAPWHVLFVAAVVVWCFLAVLYLTRVFVHPRKVFTELDCLERGNFAAAPFMTLTVFSALIATPTGEVAAGTDDLARALYWIGSSLTFVVAATRIAKWMSNRFTIDHVSPTWLLAPLGLLLSSIAGPAVEKVEDALESDRAYTESAAFFFAMAAASALLLMPLSFQAFLFQAHGDDGRRMSSWIYVAFFAGESICPTTTSYSLPLPARSMVNTC